MWACFWNHFRTPLKNGSGHFLVIFGVPKWPRPSKWLKGQAWDAICSHVQMHMSASAHRFVFRHKRNCPHVQKGGFISVLGGHGAPWAPKSVFGSESCISRPPKVTPRSDNRLKKGAKVVEKLFPNLARRTARSGLN